MATPYAWDASVFQKAASVTLPEMKLTGGIWSASCDTAADEGFQVCIPRLSAYAGGGMTVDIDWYADTATSGNAVLDAAIMAYTVGTDTSDVEAQSFSTPVTATTACSGSSQVPVTTTIALTDGAQIDNAATGDYVLLRVRRLGSTAGGTDSMSGDAQIIGVRLSYS